MSRNPGTVISPAPDVMRPTAVRIIREVLEATPSGDSPRVAASIRRTWSGWSRLDKLRLTATLAWTAGHFASLIDPVERERLLTAIEEL